MFIGWVFLNKFRLKFGAQHAIILQNAKQNDLILVSLVGGRLSHFAKFFVR